MKLRASAKEDRVPGGTNILIGVVVLAVVTSYIPLMSGVLASRPLVGPVAAHTVSTFGTSPSTSSSAQSTASRATEPDPLSSLYLFLSQRSLGDSLKPHFSVEGSPILAGRTAPDRRVGTRLKGTTDRCDDTLAGNGVSLDSY